MKLGSNYNGYYGEIYIHASIYFLIKLTQTDGMGDGLQSDSVTTVANLDSGCEEETGLLVIVVLELCQLFLGLFLCRLCSTRRALLATNAQIFKPGGRTREALFVSARANTGGFVYIHNLLTLQ